MRALIDAPDWANTPLGPRDTWPGSLHTVVEVLLGHPLPMTVLWGESLTQIYNDGYAAILGPRHPAALGQATQETWPEVWHINGPLYAGVFRGETYAFEDQLYPITRHGYLEEAYFTLSYVPVVDEVGAVSGVLVTVVETTGRVQATRSSKPRPAAGRAEHRSAGADACSGDFCGTDHRADRGAGSLRPGADGRGRPS